jgi:leucyl-tRNA synthetase
MTIKQTASNKQIEEKALSLRNVLNFTKGKTIVKVIIVEKKLVNVVVKD